MITLALDWREVLWWMQGGMAGSHLRWSVYEDMVNKVWPQATEQERRNLFLIMRRDLGYYWRPDGWPGHKLMWEKGEGEWKADDNGMAIDHDNPEGEPRQVIHDLTPWMYFRQVLARFDPDNQWAVTLRTPDSDTLESMLRLTPKASIISTPTPSKSRKYPMPLRPLIIRAYRWQDDYRIDWNRRIDPAAIVNAEQLKIPDTGEM